MYLFTELDHLDVINILIKYWDSFINVLVG